MHNPSIVITNLSKRYPKGTAFAINQLTTHFNAGETIGIIGKNGAGKSTLLSILAGVSQQTDGEVQIQGKVTAVMTLGVGLRDDLTGRENIYLDGELQGKSSAEINALMDEIIAFAELGDFIDKPLKTYSTGMKSRLAFSLLVGIEPEILIIDEALSAGDAFFAEKAAKKINELCKKGKIVILVSHAMATIATMCTRCLWLDKGQVVMDGAPNTVIQAYLKSVREDEQQKNTMPIESIQAIKPSTIKLQEITIQPVLYSQEPMTIEIRLSASTMHDAQLNMIIERRDGLKVCHEKVELSGHPSPLQMTFSLDAFMLNQGYFQLQVDIIEQGELTQRALRTFEVKNNQPITGGMPLLYYPSTFTLEHKKENEPCLDLIVQTTE